MDVFSRTAVVAALAQLSKGGLVPAPVVGRLVRAFSRYPEALPRFFHAFMRALIAQDARREVVSALLDAMCDATPGEKQPVLLAIIEGRASRGGGHETVLQVVLRIPRAYATGAGSEGTRIAVILERALDDKRGRLMHSLLESWLARRDPMDRAIVEFMREHAARLLATAPSEATVLALHRIAPSTGTWRAVANSLRARRVTQKGERRRASDDS